MSNEFAFLEEERDEARAERDRLQAQVAQMRFALEAWLDLHKHDHIPNHLRQATDAALTTTGEDYHNPQDTVRMKSLERLARLTVDVCMSTGCAVCGFASTCKKLRHETHIYDVSLPEESHNPQDVQRIAELERLVRNMSKLVLLEEANGSGVISAAIKESTQGN